MTRHFLNTKSVADHLLKLWNESGVCLSTVKVAMTCIHAVRFSATTSLSYLWRVEAVSCYLIHIARTRHKLFSRASWPICTIDILFPLPVTRAEMLMVHKSYYLGMWRRTWASLSYNNLPSSEVSDLRAGVIYCCYRNLKHPSVLSFCRLFHRTTRVSITARERTAGSMRRNVLMAHNCSTNYVGQLPSSLVSEAYQNIVA